jgi:hypothetical protein
VKEAVSKRVEVEERRRRFEGRRAEEGVVLEHSAEVGDAFWVCCRYVVEREAFPLLSSNQVFIVQL